MKRIGWGMAGMALVLALALAAPAGAAAAEDTQAVARAFQASYQAEAAGWLDYACQLISDSLPGSDENYYALMRMAYLKGLLGQPRDAARHYAAASRRRPEAVEPLLYLQAQYLALGEWADLERAARAALERDRNNYTSRTRLGWALYNQGKYTAAAEHYEQVAKLYPLDLDVLSMCGWANAYALKNARAERYFRAILIFSPDNQDARAGLNFLGLP